MPLKILGALFIGFCGAHAAQMDTQMCDMDFQTAWDDHEKFSAFALRKVCTLYPGNTVLTEEQKEHLTKSTTLVNLQTLDLRAQGIDDDFIEKLSKNKIFSRLRKIDLSDNPAVTDRSLAIISGSTIGCVREIRQGSARYEVPVSEIRVEAGGTRITETLKKIYNDAPQRMRFFIYYLHPRTGKELAKPAFNAIKWVKVS